MGEKQPVPLPAGEDPAVGGSFAAALAEFLRGVATLYESPGTMEGAQRAGLRSTFGRLVEVCAVADRRVDRIGTELFSDGEPFNAGSGAGALLFERMAQHNLESIVVRRGAESRDLMLLARLLASRESGAGQPPPDLWQVQLSSGGSVTTPRDPTSPEPAPPGGAAHVATPTPTPALAPEPAPAPAPNPTPTPGLAPTREPPHPPAPAPGADSSPAQKATIASDLHATIRTAEDAESILSQLAHRALQWAAKGNSAGVGYALIELWRLEQLSTDAGVLAACEAARGRLSRPSVLRQFAELLPSAGERAEHLEVLRQYGEAGAHALITHLMAAESLRDRRIYFDAIVSIGRGTAALIDALGHEEWFVVRNSAALLGEMVAVEADEALCRVLSHTDGRVRDAAAAALRRLGTPAANRALHGVAGGPPAQPNRAAVEALASQPWGASESALTSALDEARDEEARVAILRALGRLGTPGAVRRLTNAALQREGRGTSVACRVAALEALAQAHGAGALPLLRTLAVGEDAVLRGPARRAVAGLALA